LWVYAYGTPDPLDPEGNRGLAVRGIKRSIWVNSSGERFHNELFGGGATGTPALLNQSPPTAWAIIDSLMAQSVEIADPQYKDGDRVIPRKVLELLENSAYIKKSSTVKGLATSIGVDENKLCETVDKYNSYIRDGFSEDPDFGKRLESMIEINRAPFYAVQFFPTTRKNLGGVSTDLKCRVLTRQRDPIQSLYAAGEVAGMAGGHINGNVALEGTMLGPSIFSGRVAGAWAAFELGFGDGYTG
ncbi:MAG: FAD-binding protein, partial [Nitrososphaerales archaeon]